MIMSIFLAAADDVEMSCWLHARNATVGAVDTAVLDGVRHSQIHRGPDESETRAQKCYDTNAVNRPELLKDTIELNLVNTGTELAAGGEAVLATTVMRLAGIDSLSLVSLLGSKFSKALLAANADAEFNLEVSLMLFVTGSM